MPSLMDSIVTGKTFHRIGWLYSAVAIHDPTPVHVILGYTLGHIASLRGLEEPPQALEHKSKAIKLLHHRMADPEQCYSNGLIGAIVNFAGWEVITLPVPPSSSTKMLTFFFEIADMCKSKSLCYAYEWIRKNRYCSWRYVSFRR